MIEIKHLKTLGHCGIVDRWLLLLRCCTRLNPLCLISSAIWNNALASACSCVKPAAALTPQGKFCCNWQTGAAANQPCAAGVQRTAANSSAHRY